MKQSTNHCSK